MTRFPRNLVHVAVLALSMASVAAAQTTAPATPPAKPAVTAPGPGSTGMDKGAGTGAAASKAGKPAASVSAGDIRFMEKAAQGGMAEIELGKLAQSKAESADVKAFGKKLADDHGKAGDKLKALASGKGVTLPTAMTGEQKRDQERLAKLSGNAFDRAFMKHMVDDHKGDVRDYKSTAKSAKDADLRNFASSTLPTLEEHLALAKQTESAVKRAPKDAKTMATKSAATGGATTGGGPTGTAKSTAVPGKNTAATTGTAGPGTGMPASTEQAGTTSPQVPGGPADTKKAAPQK